MADVYAVFGTLLALGIAFPGMLLTCKILFPRFVGRAELRLEQTPGSSFGLGLIGAAVVAVPAAVLSALPIGPAKFLGAVTILGSFGLASLGAAGVASVMGRRIQGLAQREDGASRAFLQGAVALELAAAFPLIGWFLLIPLTIIISFGAALFASLRWVPAEKSAGSNQPLAVDGQIQHEPQSA